MVDRPPPKAQCADHAITTRTGLCGDAVATFLFGSFLVGCSNHCRFSKCNLFLASDGRKLDGTMDDHVVCLYWGSLYWGIDQALKSATEVVQHRLKSNHG